MTIYWLSPVDPAEAQSGGTRKLGDLSAILSARGFSSRVLSVNELPGMQWYDDDLVVVPEVYGHGLDTLIPRGVRRVSFVQCGYLIDLFGMVNGRDHPFVSTPDLVAIMTESEHSTALVRLRCPDLRVPIIRTHSSGNGRMGADAGFSYAPWPRRKVVMYFDYKHGQQNDGVFTNLPLPSGWEMQRLSGMTDEEIKSAMRSGAIFVAPNAIEGMCAPTSEAMISGCMIVGWPGGPSSYAHHPCPPWAWAITRDDPLAGGPMEYLKGRARIAAQDDVEGLRLLITATADWIDNDHDGPREQTERNSRWFRRTYSRRKETEEIVRIMAELHGRR